MSQDLQDPPASSGLAIEFGLFWILGCGVMVLGHLAAELRRHETLRDAWRAHWVSAFLGVAVVFGLPFLYSAYGVWRASGSFFIFVLSSVTMFQMGVALEAYARTVFSGPTGGSDGESAHKASGDSTDSGHRLE